MPAKDITHQPCRNALQKDGWTITHDPLHIRFLDTQMFVDLGAERLIAAEKGTEKIAVEIKSFIGSSPLTEFHHALGQFMNYREALADQDPERILYLAVPVDTYETFFLSQFGQYAIERFHLKLLVYKVKTEVIVTWKK
jgi:hypothetical protein